jgi:hypothetical protein
VYYVLFFLWPFGYHSPSDVSYDLYFHINQWCLLSSYVLFCLVVYDCFPHPMCHVFFILSYPLGIWSFILCVQSLILSSPFGLRSSTRCIVYFILPCPPGMCYFILCVFSNLTIFSSDVS